MTEVSPGDADTPYEVGLPPGHQAPFEWPRKLLHMAMTLPALLLPSISGLKAVLVCLVFVIACAWWILDGPDKKFIVMRRGENLLGGIVMYPLAILLAILFSPTSAGVMAAWGVLGIGDAVASIVGRFMSRAGRHYPLPWNDEKSWSGSAALIVSGFLAALGLLVFENASRIHQVRDGETLAILALAAALGGAILESLKTKFPDNLRVVAGAVAGCYVAELLCA